MPNGHIIVADDDAAIRTVLNQALSRAGYEVRSTGNCATLWRWVAQGEGDLVITDVVMPDENVFDLLPRIKRVRPELPIIVMSAQNTFMTAIRASERGAYEYLPKPFDLKELIAIVGRALSRPRGAAPAGAPPENEDIPLVGRSPAMQEIYRALARLMPTDLTVMITGESGTGKELVARALHDYGRRRTGPFVPVNMAAIPRDLIESELFGHEKGAFTGAVARRIGRFEEANGGTLLLDEISEMDVRLQAKLLRALQERVIDRVGGTAPVRVDIRVLATSNRNLAEEVRKGTFREDLLYRLNVVALRLPPLRERPADIIELATHFARKYAAVNGMPVRPLSPEARTLVLKNPWRGNVRELENTLHRAVLLASGDTIGPEAILSPDGETFAAEGPAARAAQVAEAATRGLVGRTVAQVECDLILDTLDHCLGNRTHAARILGISIRTLRNKLNEYVSAGLEVAEPGSVRTSVACG